MAENSNRNQVPEQGILDPEGNADSDSTPKGLGTFFDRCVLETEDGIAIYTVPNSLELFIVDFTTRLDRPVMSAAEALLWDLEDEAKRYGCQYLSCQVSLKLKCASTAISFLMQLGFQVYGTKPEEVSFVRRIE